MHGSGNDFVFINSKELKEPLSSDDIKYIANRNFGIGCDQVVIYSLLDDKIDANINIFNSDGSNGGVCGNATICMAYLLSKSSNKSSFAIKVINGVWHAERIVHQNRYFSIDVGKPIFKWQDIPLSKDCDVLNVPIQFQGAKNIVAVGMGNPHCVIITNNDNFDNILNQSYKLENHELFPNRANIGIVKVKSRSEIDLQVWERGVGFTLACGSGACAAVSAVIKLGLCDNKVTVNLPGGTVVVKWDSEDSSVFLVAPAQEVYSGKIQIKL